MLESAKAATNITSKSALPLTIYHLPLRNEAQVNNIVVVCYVSPFLGSLLSLGKATGTRN